MYRRAIAMWTWFPSGTSTARTQAGSALNTAGEFKTLPAAARRGKAPRAPGRRNERKELLCSSQSVRP